MKRVVISWGDLWPEAWYLVLTFTKARELSVDAD